MRVIYRNSLVAYPLYHWKSAVLAEEINKFIGRIDDPCDGFIHYCEVCFDWFERPSICAFGHVRICVTNLHESISFEKPLSIKYGMSPGTTDGLLEWTTCVFVHAFYMSFNFAQNLRLTPPKNLKYLLHAYADSQVKINDVNWLTGVSCYQINKVGRFIYWDQRWQHRDNWGFRASTQWYLDCCVCTVLQTPIDCIAKSVLVEF